MGRDGPAKTCKLCGKNVRVRNDYCAICSQTGAAAIHRKEEDERIKEERRKAKAAGSDSTLVPGTSREEVGTSDGVRGAAETPV